LAMLREEFGRNFLHVDFEPDCDALLRVQFFFRTLSGLLVARGRYSPMAAWRSRSLVADEGDDLVFVVSLADVFHVAQRNREIACRQGDAYLMSCGEPARAPRVSRQVLALRIPREVLAARVPDIDAAILRPISRDLEALRLLRSYVGAL